MKFCQFALTSCIVAAFGLAATGARADIYSTGTLLVTDYGLSQLDRYSYTWDQTTNAMTFTNDGLNSSSTTAVLFSNSTYPVKEGVQGTNNDLILVSGAKGSSHTVLSRFTSNGAFVSSISVDFSAYNGGNTGIGNVAITADGKYVYAPLSSANAIVKIDLATGNIVASYDFQAAHDVAIDPITGDIYAANYTGSTPKVIVLDSNLNYKQDLISKTIGNVPSDVGVFRPTGLSVASDGSLYVDINNGNSISVDGPDSVVHYDISGTSTLTATVDPNTDTSYIGSSTNNALEFTFGNNIGPDGRIYIAALGGGGTDRFGVTNGYTDGIYALDPTTGLVSLVIAGATEDGGTATAGASGLDAPKYLQFSSNFVPASDPGYTVPEPSTIGLSLTALAGLAAIRRNTRRPAGKI